MDRHRELGIDPDRIALYGTSAGGCLAAATALLARDRGGENLAPDAGLSVRIRGYRRDALRRALRGEEPP